MIIQALRNVQKQRAPLDHFIRSLDEFIDKYQPQLGALVPPGELAESSRFRSLSGAIKSASIGLKDLKDLKDGGGGDDSEAALSHLSRLLNEFMQNLDKLNSFYIQQSLIMK